jgi:hypothetical protein
MAKKRLPYAGAKELWDPGPPTPRGNPLAPGHDDAPARPSQPYSPADLGEAYDVSVFARKHNLNRATAIDILMRAGPSRERADELAVRSQESGGL